MMKNFERTVPNVTPEDLQFIREYTNLPVDKKILISGIVIGVSLDDKNQALKKLKMA